MAEIQGRTQALMDRAAAAMVDMLDALRDARAAGAGDPDLASAYRLQRRAQWRLDFISSENSLGFHAAQEAARILAESIDDARRAAAMALSLRTPPAPPSQAPVQPVEGVTPTDQAPTGSRRRPGPATSPSP